MQRVSHIIIEDRHVTIDDMQLVTFLCHAKIPAIIHRLEDEEDLCTLSSKGSHSQTTREEGAELAELLALHNKDPEIFFARLVIGDDSWLHNRIPEVHRQSMQW